VESALDDLVASHVRKFGKEPEVITSAPGRVNLMGDHTEHSEGFVLPIAVGFSLRVAMSRRHDTALRFYSVDFNDIRRTSLLHNRVRREDRWANYPKGVIAAFLDEGYHLGGLDATFAGDIPQGVGLASSGALAVATALALKELFDLDICRLDLAALAQRAETEFVKVDCGIADGYTSLFATPGNGLLIDTRTLDSHEIPVKFSNAKIIITNSNVPKEFVETELLDRKEECTRCVAFLNRRKPGRALRDYSPHDVSDVMGRMPERERRRGLHVVEENARVLEAEEALQNDDPEALGKLMNRSHESLRDLYEVTCPELDWLVKRAWETEGVYGSRMTGEGFGGCTVSLIGNSMVDEYLENIEQYERIFGFKAASYVTEPAGGATVLRSRVLSRPVR
jgi:galactokinase